ncbi:hypothetical protein [uncultured Dokdonia sp.]|uniref:hypothetical protein n=1 Tax=uncultured Dokdonia sp. TaxID=575653 RepID=UPI0030EE46BE|tara:strand:+ start:6517 stop:7032 length:516 start_codon:yes stop_codon:yes gene_type:complete
MTQLERLSALLVDEFENFSGDIKSFQKVHHELYTSIKNLENINVSLNKTKEQIQNIHITPDLSELKTYEEHTQKISDCFIAKIKAVTQQQINLFQSTSKKALLFYKSLIIILFSFFIIGTGFGLYEISELRKKYQNELKKSSQFKSNLRVFFESDSRAYKSFIDWKKNKYD